MSSVSRGQPNDQRCTNTFAYQEPEEMPWCTVLAFLVDSRYNGERHAVTEETE